MNAEQTVERAQTDWGFLAKWIIVTTITTAAAIFLGISSMWLVGDALEKSVGQPIGWAIAGGLLGALTGLGIGGGQAFALSGKGGKVNLTRWVLYSTLGGGLVSAVTFGLVVTLSGTGSNMSNTQIALILGTTLGLGIGFGQWLAIRGHLPNSGVWILITVIALVAAVVIGFNLGGEGREILASTILGLIAAGLTGLGAVWLFGGGRPAIAAQVGVLLAVGLLLSACGGNAQPSVRFTEPRDGATANAPVRVVMSAKNFTVEPAGDGSIHDGAGHLHIMVDTPCIAAGQTVPKDETHLHFGDGSTETELALEPGTHTLCLQAADGAHTALPGEGMTHTINITVP